MDDEYFSQRAEDLLSVGKHLINTMQRIASSVELENNSIIVAVDLTPADTSSMNMSYINGIILKEGGTTIIEGNDEVVNEDMNSGQKRGEVVVDTEIVKSSNSPVASIAIAEGN